MPLQHYINHIAIVVDKSGSMQKHTNTVVQVFDQELARLKQRSIELDQETRISIYLFNNQIECLTFDMDVMRFNSLRGYYHATGQTALLDAIAKSTEDHQKLPQIYGDHAFLQYIITDGEENNSKTSIWNVKYTLEHLPENWTTACLVPSPQAKFEAKKFGIDENSIALWNTESAVGFESVGRGFRNAVDNYMEMRSRGVRGTKTLFTLDSSKITSDKLDEVPAWSYDVYPVYQEAYIKPYVESLTKSPYRLGSAYYQPTKTVKIQDHKNILVQNAKNGRVYEGSNLRSLLGLPQSTAEVNPGQHSNWRILVQSTSVNRKLLPNTFVLIRK